MCHNTFKFASSEAYKGRSDLNKVRLHEFACCEWSKKDRCKIGMGTSISYTGKHAAFVNAISLNGLNTDLELGTLPKIIAKEKDLTILKAEEDIEKEAKENEEREKKNDEREKKERAERERREKEERERRDKEEAARRKTEAEKKQREDRRAHCCKIKHEHHGGCHHYNHCWNVPGACVTGRAKYCAGGIGCKGWNCIKYAGCEGYRACTKYIKCGKIPGHCHEWKKCTKECR